MSTKRTVITLPPSTRFLVINAGPVRHVVDDSYDGKSPKGLTWCNLFHAEKVVEPYMVGTHGHLPICGACLRTLKAKKASVS